MDWSMAVAANQAKPSLKMSAFEGMLQPELQSEHIVPEGYWRCFPTDLTANVS